MINPVAFTIFHIEVRWYGILIALAMIIAGYIAVRNAQYDDLSSDDIVDFILWALPFCIIGARLYYVIFEWQYYQGDFFKIINIRQGGLAIHGGLIAGFIVAYIYCNVKNIKFLKFIDIICVSLPLGQSIGRWGNFTNSEAYGSPTDLPWAIVIDGQKVHPTFLYESIWNLILFTFFIFLFKRKKFDGQILSLYMILYSIGRFWIEGLRTDSLMIFGLKTAQIVSLLLILAGSISYMLFKKRKRVY